VIKGILTLGLFFILACNFESKVRSELKIQRIVLTQGFDPKTAKLTKPSQKVFKYGAKEIFVVIKYKGGSSKQGIKIRWFYFKEDPLLLKENSLHVGKEGTVAVSLKALKGVLPPGKYEVQIEIPPRILSREHFRIQAPKEP
jgi:hypothetical protein